MCTRRCLNSVGGLNQWLPEDLSSTDRIEAAVTHVSISKQHYGLFQFPPVGCLLVEILLCVVTFHGKRYYLCTSSNIVLATKASSACA